MRDAGCGIEGGGAYGMAPAVLACEGLEGPL